MFIFAIPAVYTMDTYGRRNLLLLTFPQMAWCLLAAGFCFLMPESNSARVPLIAFFVYLFIAFYGPGKLIIRPCQESELILRQASDLFHPFTFPSLSRSPIVRSELRFQYASIIRSEAHLA